MANGLIFILVATFCHTALSAIDRIRCTAYKMTCIHTQCGWKWKAQHFIHFAQLRILLPRWTKKKHTFYRTIVRERTRQSAHFRISHYNYGVTMANDNVDNNNNHVICFGVMRASYLYAVRGTHIHTYTLHSGAASLTGSDSNSNGFFITRSIYTVIAISRILSHCRLG